MSCRPLGPEDKDRVSRLSRPELDDLATEFLTQLAQARVDWSALDDPPFSKNVTMVARIPITNGLTETAFLDKFDEIELVSIMARGLLTADIKRYASRKSP
jgi:hypothetical protein